MLGVACRRESFFLDENRNEMSSRLAEQDVVPATWYLTTDEMTRRDDKYVGLNVGRDDLTLGNEPSSAYVHGT